MASDHHQKQQQQHHSAASMVSATKNGSLVGSYLAPRMKLKPLAKRTSMVVTIRSPMGLEMRLPEVKPDDLVYSLKERIEDGMSIPAFRQRLVYANQVLMDDATIESTGITEDSVLTLIPMLRSGPSNEQAPPLSQPIAYSHQQRQQHRHQQHAPFTNNNDHHSHNGTSQQLYRSSIEAEDTQDVDIKSLLAMATSVNSCMEVDEIANNVPPASLPFLLQQQQQQQSGLDASNNSNNIEMPQMYQLAVVNSTNVEQVTALMRGGIPFTVRHQTPDNQTSLLLYLPRNFPLDDLKLRRMNGAWYMWIQKSLSIIPTTTIDSQGTPLCEVSQSNNTLKCKMNSLRESLKQKRLRKNENIIL